MKRVLITGGAGFIGHHIIEHLLKNTDWEIVSLDRLGVSGNYNRLTEIECWKEQGHRVKFFHHDLRSPVNESLYYALCVIDRAPVNSFDYILHLAASTHVDRSITDPMSFVLDNVVATTNILEYARKQEGLKAFLYFSTDEVFGPAPEGVAYKEWDRYNSGNPYAAAKAGGEELALAYANTYRLPTIITHTMNVFGERQHPEKFIPMTIRKILKREKILIHANKDRTKPGSRFWIHGRNVAAALVFLLDIVPPQLGTEIVQANGTVARVYADKFNIVGEREVNNLEMAELIFEMVVEAKMNEAWTLDYELVDFHSSRPGHDLRYALDGSKMKAIGWELPVDFHQSLKKTVEWSIKNPSWLNL